MNRRDILKLFAAGAAVAVAPSIAIAAAEMHVAEPKVRQIGTMVVERSWRADLPGVPMMFLAMVTLARGRNIEGWDYCELAPPSLDEDGLDKFSVGFYRRASGCFRRARDQGAVQ